MDFQHPEMAHFLFLYDDFNRPSKKNCVYLAFHFGKGVVAVSMEGVGFPIKGGYVRALSNGTRSRGLKALTSPPAIQTYTESSKMIQMNKITELNIMFIV